jgi:hypothetical protein
VTLPVAVTVFPKDIPRAPRSWIEIPVSEIRTGLHTLRS